MTRRYIEWDLIIVGIIILLQIMLCLAFPVPFLREILGLLFILYLPGYVLAAVFFPGQQSLETTTRIALSLCLSVAVVVFIGLILGITPVGFTFHSVLITLSIFSIIISGLAWYLRSRYNRGNISQLKVPSFFTEIAQILQKASRGYRILVVFLFCVIFAGLGSLGYVFTTPLPPQYFSEFYVLDSAGKAGDYPRELEAGEEGRVILNIVSHESQETSYSVQVKAGGIMIYNLPDIALEPGAKWQGNIGFNFQEAGENQKVEFILNNNESKNAEIRYIWVNVVE